MVKTAEEAALRAGLLNTFFNVELWKIGNESRRDKCLLCISVLGYVHKDVWLQ
jgi:hypothetical protein